MGTLCPEGGAEGKEVDEISGRERSRVWIHDPWERPKEKSVKETEQ